MKIKQNTIYVTTVIQIRPKEYVRRIWGWYPTLREAETTVSKNYGDIFESGYYKYAIIEEIQAGFIAIVKNEWWYQGIYNNGKTIVKKIKKPKKFEGIVHFSMG